MNSTDSQSHRFSFIGGQLCLDFANTVGGSRQGVPREHLHSYGDFLSWSRQAGILNETERKKLVREGARRPSHAGAVFRRAILLREAIYRIFSSLAEKRPIRENDIGVINAELSAALVRSRLVATKSGFGWDWEIHEDALDRPLWPVAQSVADLLTSSESLKGVHECESATCGWLFLDTSKNHSRRWCDMRDCGTRAKVQRYRKRQRSARSRAPK